MENIKNFVESKIQETEAQLEQMAVGINARKALAGKVSEKIRQIKKCKAAIAQHGLSTDLIDEMHRDAIESFQENEAILKNLKAYRSNAHMELMTFKKALENINEN